MNNFVIEYNLDFSAGASSKCCFSTEAIFRSKGREIGRFISFKTSTLFIYRGVYLYTSMGSTRFYIP